MYTKKIAEIIDIEIEFFSFESISFDITKHKYFFPHIKLNNDEKTEFINKRNKQVKGKKVKKYLAWYIGITKNEYASITPNEKITGKNKKKWSLASENLFLKPKKT